MKTTSWLLCAALCTAVLSGCSNDLGTDLNEKEADRINEYTTAWVKKFGPFDPNHDWCMLRAVNADIAIGAIGGTSVQVYNFAPNDGGHIIGVANADTRLVLDLPKSATEVYALITDADGNVVSEGMYEVAENDVRIDGNAIPLPDGMSRYAHGSYNWFDAMIACEDLGSIGDFDFNDVVLGLRHIAGTKTLEIVPMAAGGTMPVTVKFDGNEIGEIHSLLAGANTSTASMLNTKTYSIKSAVYRVSVDQNFTIANDWNKLSLVVNDGSKSAYPITANSKGVKNAAPQLICLGGDWFWPTETTDISESYPRFQDWTNNADVQTWCVNYKDMSLVVPWNPDDVRCYFVGSTTSGTFKAYVNDESLSSPVTVAPSTPYFTSAPSTCRYMFNAGNSNLTGLYLQNFDVSHVTDMMCMFRDNNNLTTILFGDNWDTSQVTTMAYMFYGCNKLQNTDNLTNWDVQKVTSMLNMFAYCNILTDAWTEGIASWNVSTEPIDMRYMFDHCNSITSIDLSEWRAKPTDLNCMFAGCSNLKSINLDYFDVTLLGACSGARNMQTFSGCKNLESLSLKRWKIPTGLYIHNVLDTGVRMTAEETSLDLTGWDCTLRTSQDNNDGSLYRLLGLLDWVTTYIVTDWNLNGVKNMTGIFQDCPKLSQIVGLSSWNVSTVENMSYMFASSEKLTTLDLSGWRTTGLTNVSEMFYSCKALDTLYIDNFDMSHVTNMDQMFNDANPDLKIRCSATTRAWLIEHADDVYLPAKLNPNSESYDASHWL